MVSINKKTVIEYVELQKKLNSIYEQSYYEQVLSDILVREVMDGMNKAMVKAIQTNVVENDKQE